jgi:hypothetical protein
MRIISGFLLIAAMSITACTTTRVANVETAPGADLKQYQTFGFYELKASGDTTMAHFDERVNLIKDAITAEMTKRGFKVSANPQLLVNIGIVVKEEIQTRTTDWQTDGRYTYVGQRNYKWESKEVEVGRYRQGAITLHVVDAAKNVMLWRGTVNGVMPDDENNIPKAVAAGMKELFLQFPVN